MFKKSLLVFGLAAGFMGQALSASPAPLCRAEAGATVTPVLELYTSEGCSSCPPADRWLSALRTPQRTAGNAVIQAFHVGYWDYIGWVDRFASPIHTTRQRQIAQWNDQRSIYTPQTVLNGKDWRGWTRAGDGLPASAELARFGISLRQTGDDHFEAAVTALDGAPAAWNAYWTITESGHSSRVKAGENAGELLRHDHVVRQYTEAGTFRTAVGAPQRVTLRAIAPAAGHLRNVNLVLFDNRNGRTLQAVTAACPG
ncbi:MAG: DUF1223 domain-containing protein [Rhodoferax sp.]|nr:DUF1223 domain-containing protein [Rhodoferax sp.]